MPPGSSACATAPRAAATLRSISARGWRCGCSGSPPPFGFDLTLPVFLSAMLGGLWRGPRRAIGWAVAGVVALAAAYFIAGWWFIVIGAVAGSIVGGFVDDAA